MSYTKTLDGLIGAATNLIVPFSGLVTGSAATYGLQQLGLGKKPHRPLGKHPIHGAGLGTELLKLGLIAFDQTHRRKAKPMTGGNSTFLRTNNSSFNSVIYIKHK